ncbi:glutathione peroxidase [Cryptococcus deuterogattii R265]|uniref:glutathione peroxidase n=1 Tax=Cryptococcus deuterogattii (strain R265) TaxID=294750 RepID=UPI00193872DA|nr:glutathione peroxidase [Cryptococcus deuterogattii R265]
MTFFDSIASKFGYESIPADVANKSFYDLKAKLPGNKGDLDFSTLKGKAVLIVNTASKCGFTPQYNGLEELYKTYGDKGLVVLGFPSNEFGGQEPGSDDDIAQFCTLNHGVTFPLMKKSEVNGKNMNEVFAWLKSQKGEHVGGVAGTTAIKWNFTKFLVDKEGKCVGRYGSSTKPEKLKEEIEKLLS